MLMVLGVCAMTLLALVRYRVHAETSIHDLKDSIGKLEQENQRLIRLSKEEESSIESSMFSNDKNEIYTVLTKAIHNRTHVWTPTQTQILWTVIEQDLEKKYGEMEQDLNDESKEENFRMKYLMNIITHLSVINQWLFKEESLMAKGEKWELLYEMRNSYWDELDLFMINFSWYQKAAIMDIDYPQTDKED